MIVQNIELTRILLILFLGSFISGFFFYLAYKILIRNFSRITLTLSSFYIFPAIGFAINIVFLILSKTGGEEKILYILYFITFFFILFGAIFIPIFIVNILNLEPGYSSKRDIIIIIIYAICIIILMSFPGGITVNEKTDWIPIYSWTFFIISCILFTSIFILTFILSFRLYRKLEDTKLKKKLKLFFIGIFVLFITIYGSALYNTWNYPFFRVIWTFLSSILVITSGILIYYGIGQNL
ncbi:MAG: hypothetical protein ACFFAN_08790 [Promethearchaeota archaeon]